MWKNALAELISDTGEKITGIRTGEKLHETLINEDEIRYSWEFENMYMIASPLYTLFNDKNIKESYQGIKKIEDVQKYSSDNVEKISVKDLKTIIENTGLLNENNFYVLLNSKVYSISLNPLFLYKRTDFLFCGLTLARYRFFGFF